MKSFGKKLLANVHYLVFLIYTFFNALIFSQIPAFGDDYYYGTFFYHGISHFFKENLNHYLQTNGRAWVHVFDEIILAGHQMIAFAVLGTLSMSLIAWFMASLVTNTYEKKSNELFKIALPLSCFALSTISLGVLRQSVFWATGACNYLFPTLLLFLVIYLSVESVSKSCFKWYYPLVVFFASSSTELASMGTLIVVIFVLIVLINENKKSLTFYVSLGLAIAGVLLLFLSPGNFVRTSYYPEFYDLNFYEKVLKNLTPILFAITSRWGMGTILCLILSVDAYGEYKKTKNDMKSVIWLAIDVVGIAPTLLIRDFEINALTYIRSVLLLAAIIVLIVRSGVRYRINNGDFSVLFLCLALLLQCPMLISPEYGPRIVLISIMLSAIYLVASVLKCELSIDLLFVILVISALSMSFVRFGLVIVAIGCINLVISKLIKNNKISLVLMTLLVLSLGLRAQYVLFTGYNENFKIHEINEDIVNDYITGNYDDDSIELFYLTNHEYKYTMPYDNTYHLYWYKQYNKIPDKTNIGFHN